jgi:hypothetical protein
MKRTLVLASIAVVALVAAAIAVGHGIDGVKNVKEVTGTFTATTVSKLQTRTCTTSDGKTLVATNGTYTGTASGDADLTGPARINARSVVNTTDGVGVVSGRLRHRRRLRRRSGAAPAPSVHLDVVESCA